MAEHLSFGVRVVEVSQSGWERYARLSKAGPNGEVRQQTMAMLKQDGGKETGETGWKETNVRIALKCVNT